jgi:hypothetical protein
LILKAFRTPVISKAFCQAARLLTANPSTSQPRQSSHSSAIVDRHCKVFKGRTLFFSLAMSESHIPAKPVSSGFRYTPLANPLTEIRLAILEPALSDDDEIRCQLHTVNIAEAKYESLSYAWGDESVKVLIIFCGQPFMVTANLAYALRNLRFESSDPKKKRALWIDALCIDQCVKELLMLLILLMNIHE